MKSIQGWINLYKPKNISSFQAINEIKRKFSFNKIGHAGTLDPLAEGVLPIALGKTTKLISYINNSNKTYTCTVNWGSQTSTDDTEGEILLKSNKLPKINEILSKLPNFIGKYKQTPPKVSAVKVRGQRAYKLARKNINFEILPKEVEVSKLEVVSHEKFNTTFIINCGKGFYIRSFARDLGRELQTYGHISFLERTNVGKFDKKSSILLDDLLKIGQRQLEINCIISSISMLDDILAYEIVDPDDIKNLSFGRSIKINENSSKYFHSKSIDKKNFFLSYKGNIVSIGKLIGNLFKPDKVLI